MASESLQEMVHEMESQLNHVMSSSVFHTEVQVSYTEEEEKADAFQEAEPPQFDDGEEIAKTLDVPRWLSDEKVVGEHCVAMLYAMDSANILWNCGHSTITPLTIIRLLLQNISRNQLERRDLRRNTTAQLNFSDSELTTPIPKIRMATNTFL